MDNAPPAWQAGFPLQHNALFGSQLDAPQNQDDWEEWLRWDPSADYASPEDGTTNSGSSKNDSPIQDSVLPVDAELFGKGDTLAPPLVMGEDAFDFGANDGGDAFLFGAQNDGSASFDFHSLTSIEQPHPSMPRVETNPALWNTVGSMDASNINLSALTNDPYQTLPSAGTVSSTAPSMHFSPEASQNGTSVTSNSPDPPKKRGGRKRKAEIQEEIKEQNGDSNGSGDEPPVKKTSHNVIEKRYRNNLNDKIVELRNSVPALRAVGRANGKADDDEDLEGLTAAHKLNKATVMAKATEYIKHLEKRNKTISDEMDALKARLAAVESAIGKSRDRQASISTSPPDTSGRGRQLSSASQNGFLSVPQQQMLQQQYMQPQSQPTYARQPSAPVEAQNQPQYVNARGGAGVMNKIMLGTMAGIMVMEGFSSEQQAGDDTSTRGLFAVPTHLIKRGLGYASSAPSETAVMSRYAMWSLLKMFLILGALLCILTPLVAFSPRRKQKTRPSAVRLPPPPSLASPIEVRRKAWLTALQTVWVPKHFVLEVVAVTLKMISLSLRRLVGSDAYNSLTGAIKEEEVARIKAWDIAVDAQLAGGDAEVSYYRLLLTLMESGTLPDSPTRLMQKAVHFRVFFWELANAGYGNLLGFKSFTEKVGKIYWDSARRQQKELAHAKTQGRPSYEDDEIDLLPDHLVSLLELDCDEVLSDEMIQRAWNLAWNQPSAHLAKANAARDSVVEDHAIRSPLDAVAAWFTNMIVDDTLAESLTPGASTMDLEYYIGLAVSIAPPASSTLARALAAKAVLSNTNRDTNVLAALDALPAVSSPSSDMNLVAHVPATPDIRTALTLGKLLALSAPTASAKAQTRAINMIAALHISPGSFTLLTAAAAAKLLRNLTSDSAAHRHLRTLPANTQHGMEDLATNLRVWIGTSASRNAGLGDDDAGAVIEMCLGIAKKAGGWGEKDSGYGSGSTEVSPVATRAEVVVA